MKKSKVKQETMEAKLFGTILGSSEEKRKFEEMFNFICVISEGAFGLVIAVHLKKESNRIVALKIINKGKHDQKSTDLFRRESVILQKFNHDNILKCYGVLLFLSLDVRND
jgi:serine/threonine protein kinase